MKICVFCSANQQIDPDFFAMTEELGRWAASNGHALVYGGVNQGLMESLGKAAKEAGGRTIGNREPSAEEVCPSSASAAQACGTNTQN